MRKILALLLLTTPLAAAPRLLSPERPVGDPKPMTNFLASQSIDIASNGNTAIAAWTDVRGGGCHRHLRHASHQRRRGGRSERNSDRGLAWRPAVATHRVGRTALPLRLEFRQRDVGSRR